MTERRTLNRTYFCRGSSANLPRLHTCENKVPFWDFSQFAVTIITVLLKLINEESKLWAMTDKSQEGGTEKIFFKKIKQVSCCIFMMDDTYPDQTPVLLKVG